MKPILYISGPYSAETLIDRQQNILDAKRRFIDALATGEWWAVCPHTHTDGLETHLPQIPHEEWLKMDITMLAGCDALWVDSDNELSDGVMLETAWAIESGMPVYYTPYIAKPGFMEDNGCDIDNRLLQFAKNNIFQMVSRGEIPDPKTYKGSALK